jgi:translation initiation factor 5B
MNKVDRIHGWITTKSKSLKKCLEKQKKDTLMTLKECSNRIIAQIANLEINACLYYENKNINEYVSMVPVSAVNGDGIADLIVLISKLTTKNLKDKLETALYKHTHGYVLDIKKDIFYGLLCYTILTKGNLKRNDEVVLESSGGKIIHTKIKDIFVPEESKEMKNKTQLKPQIEVQGTIGVALKFADNECYENLQLGGLIIYDNKNIDNFLKENTVNTNDEDIRMNYNFEKHGISINVPEKSMANAVIQLLNNEKDKIKIPVSEIHIGQITKTMIIKVANNNQADKNNNLFEYEYNKRFAVILDYNNNYAYSNGKELLDKSKLYEHDIIELAKKLGVYIISDSIIYGLFNHYKNFINEINKNLKMIYPNIIKQVRLKILPQFVFIKKNPLLFGVKVISGELKKDNIVEAVNNLKVLKLGKVIGIQKNKKNVDIGKTGDEICIRIETCDTTIEYGKHFDGDWEICNHMTHNDKILQKKYCDVFN